MTLINQIINSIFDILLFPFQSMNQFWGIFFISILSGLLLIYIFKITSNQKAIKRVKNRIKSHIFEIRLFDLNPSRLFGVLFKILGQNLKYISYSAVPLLFMIIPVILILVQLNFRYGLRAHYPGEKTLLKIYLAQDTDILSIHPAIDTKGQAVVDAGPFRNLAGNYIAYQLKVTEPGNDWIDIELNQGNDSYKIRKLFNNLPDKRRYSDKKPSGKALDVILYPFEKPVKKTDSGIVKEITMSYNENRISVLGIKMHYIIFFFIFSLAGGFLFKGAVGAEI